MNTLMQAIGHWWNADASWWQFWMPGSGPWGGFIFGATGTCVLVLAIKLWRLV